MYLSLSKQIGIYPLDCLNANKQCFINRMQFEHDCEIIFFLSLPLCEFPFFPARNFYAKAYEQRKVSQKTQASGHICVNVTQT